MLLSSGRWALAQDVDDEFLELVYPSEDELKKAVLKRLRLQNPFLLGTEKPTDAQKDKTQKIVEGTPKGPRPIDIAQSFVDRFALSDPDAISQWPADAAWNPLVVEFFTATSLVVKNDMVPWCAAFANWCITRAGIAGTNSAASQSFLVKEFFEQTDDPQFGDVAIFTCYSKSTGKSVGLGHVTFFKEWRGEDKILVIGGNQSADGRSSIISEKEYRTGARDVWRTIDGERVLVTMKLNTFARMPEA